MTQQYPKPATFTPNLFSAIASGEVPLSGGGTRNFLRADGSWTVPAGLTLFTTSASGMVPASGLVMLRGM